MRFSSACALLLVGALLIAAAGAAAGRQPSSFSGSNAPQTPSAKKKEPGVETPLVQVHTPAPPSGTKAQRHDLGVEPATTAGAATGRRQPWSFSAASGSNAPPTPSAKKAPGVHAPPPPSRRKAPPRAKNPPPPPPSPFQSVEPADEIGLLLRYIPPSQTQPNSNTMKINVNPGLVTDGSPPPPSPPPPPPKKGLIIGLAVGGGVVLLVIIGVSIWLCLRWKHKRQQKAKERDQEEDDEDDKAMDENFQRGMGPRRFRLTDLAAATDNFADDKKLGRGGFGSVYRGFSHDLNCEVAIKKLSEQSNQGKKEYAAEVTIISNLRHKNLVRLLGWCHQQTNLLLVYELMPKGSLDKHLHGADSNLLQWSIRQQIVIGIGSAIQYLHEGLEQCVVHRDIKPSNVMLDASFVAKLGDFGLARRFEQGREEKTTDFAGTIGYVDPVCHATRKTNKESDVYSFGVVILEVASGRGPTVYDQTTGDEIHLSRWVWDLYGKHRLLEAADARLGLLYNPEEMQAVLTVGLACAQQDSSRRPSIREAIGMLRLEMALPDLPEKMPEAASMPAVGTSSSAGSMVAQATGDGATESSGGGA